jgi:hypothetical protein
MKKLFQESLMSKFRAAEALINIFEGSDDDSKCADDLMDDDEIDILEKRLSKKKFYHKKVEHSYLFYYQLY